LSALPVYIVVCNFFNNASIIFVKSSTVLCYPNPRHPLVQLFFGVCAKISNVFWILGLDLRMLDGKAVLGRRFELGLPFDAVVNLKILINWLTHIHLLSTTFLDKMK